MPSNSKNKERNHPMCESYIHNILCVTIFIIVLSQLARCLAVACGNERIIIKHTTYMHTLTYSNFIFQAQAHKQWLPIQKYLKSLLHHFLSLSYVI